ncbi:MAG TPA: universal stress protein [Ilumatobacteraceae bacterium]
MATKIVVGVDGSETSWKALRWAAYAARRRHAELRIVSCYTFAGYRGLDGAVYPSAIDLDTLKEGATAVINRAIAVVETIDAGLVVDGVTPLSAPVAGITDEARPGDEIVVGATGHSGLLGGLLGSVATGVVHRAHVPVVVVPAESGAEAGDRMSKIVVGVDGSAESLVALHWAYDEAAATGADLDVVHAWLYPYPVSDDSPREVRRPMELDAQRELEASVQALGPKLTDGSVRVHPQLYEHTPADALIEDGENADLIVVGSRGRGGLRARLLGSVSRTTIQHAPCPVAVVRGPENERSR